ncbi:MAG: flotillin [candidate division Zixibacteria bacterium]|nr:flotillin [candidate division Zixibacteria bacterium]MBU1469590.1 flotillin [candidate division Zixibacteria bacterium]MBU2625105.1 flotillin [candidate division Zixibacteria bacterium]
MSPLVIIIIAVVVIMATIVVVVLKNYRKVGPNEVLIVSGGKKRSITMPDGSVRQIGYRFRIGGGTFVRPFIEQAQILPLEIIPMEIQVDDAISTNGIRCTVRGTAEVKIAGDEPSIHLASEQFLGKAVSDIRDVAFRTLEGSTRALIGTMNIESLNKNRKDFAAKVFDDVGGYFSNMGLKLLSFNLKEITDPSGYLEALGKPRIVEARRDAEVAEAEAARDAIIKSAQAKKDGDIAKLIADTEVAEANQDLQLKNAELQTELNRRKADADFSYELQRHKLNQDLKTEEGKVRLIEKNSAIEIEKKEIERVEQELDATVRKPAEAEQFRLEAEAKGMAEAKRIQGVIEAELIEKIGRAEAEALRKKAESWNSYSQPALLQMMFEKLPELAREMAAPISKIDKIVMISNDGKLGTSKVTGELASMMAQLPTVVKSLSGFDLESWLKKLSEQGGQEIEHQPPKSNPAKE